MRSEADNTDKIIITTYKIKLSYKGNGRSKRKQMEVCS